MEKIGYCNNASKSLILVMQMFDFDFFYTFLQRLSLSLMASPNSFLPGISECYLIKKKGRYRCD